MIQGPSVKNHFPLDLRESVNLKKFTLKSFFLLMVFSLIGWSCIGDGVYCSENSQAAGAVVEVSDADDTELQKLKTKLNEITDKDGTGRYYLLMIKEYTDKILSNIEKTQIKKTFIESVIGLINIILEDTNTLNENLYNFGLLLLHFNELLIDESIKDSVHKDQLIKYVIGFMKIIGKDKNLNNINLIFILLLSVFKQLLYNFNELLKNKLIQESQQKKQFIKSAIELMNIIEEDKNKDDYLLNLEENIEYSQLLLSDFNAILKDESMQKNLDHNKKFIESVIKFMEAIQKDQNKNSLKNNITNFQLLLSEFNSLLQDGLIKDATQQKEFIKSVIELMKIIHEIENLKDNINNLIWLLYKFNRILSDESMADSAKIFIQSVIGLMNEIQKHQDAQGFKDQINHWRNFLDQFKDPFIQLLPSITNPKDKDEVIKSVIELMKIIHEIENLKDNINNLIWLLNDFNDLLKDELIKDSDHKDQLIKSVIGLMKIIQQEQHKNNLKDNINNFRWLLDNFNDLLKDELRKDPGFIDSVIGLMKIIQQDQHKNNLKDNIENFKLLLWKFSAILKDGLIKDSGFIESVIGLINIIGEDTDSLKYNINNFRFFLYVFLEILENKLIKTLKQKDELIKSVIGLMKIIGKDKENLKDNIYNFQWFLYYFNDLLRDESIKDSGFIDSVIGLMNLIYSSDQKENTKENLRENIIYSVLLLKDIVFKRLKINDFVLLISDAIDIKAQKPSQTLEEIITPLKELKTQKNAEIRGNEAEAEEIQRKLSEGEVSGVGTAGSGDGRLPTGSSGAGSPSSRAGVGSAGGIGTGVGEAGRALGGSPISTTGSPITGGVSSGPGVGTPGSGAPKKAATPTGSSGTVGGGGGSPSSRAGGLGFPGVPSGSGDPVSTTGGSSGGGWSSSGPGGGVGGSKTSGTKLYLPGPGSGPVTPRAPLTPGGSRSSGKPTTPDPSTSPSSPTTAAPSPSSNPDKLSDFKTDSMDPNSPNKKKSSSSTYIFATSVVVVVTLTAIWGLRRYSPSPKKQMDKFLQKFLKSKIVKKIINFLSPWYKFSFAFFKSDVGSSPQSNQGKSNTKRIQPRTNTQQLKKKKQRYPVVPRYNNNYPVLAF